ncbi:hypothetical protein ECBP2_0002 [Escherichia phage ECBP2]|uniref:Uncharacterized protein n=1 Tax=Escherichia phage ECBP2 TaxID=1604355 RepID=J9SN33_9CAUD|nr:hypothetical protein ECBP2_0002 [Escherichia phage ECBP2]AFR52035.1 hypothetical protein ECBP2_0002 [Escherichia phage ECBP2]
MFLDFLSELIPYFRTETCAFKVEEDGDFEVITCLGRLVDLDDDEDFDVTIDLSSLGWLYMRFCITYKPETYKDYRYTTEGENDE